MSPLELILSIGLVLASSFLSASEVALFSLSRFQLRQIRENFLKTFQRIRTLRSDPPGLLLTILVSNELVNIALSTLIAGAIARSWLDISASLPPTLIASTPTWLLQTIVGIVITAPILLLLCETTPKTIGARMNQLVAPASARIMTILYNAFTPVRKTIYLFTRMGEKTATDSDEIREDDILLMLEEGQKEGTIHENEITLIRNVLQLDDTRVQEVYTPLSKVFLLHKDTPLDKASTLYRQGRHHKIPVYDKSQKDICGMLYAKDLTQAKLSKEHEGKTIEVLAREPYFVNLNVRLSTLFRRLKNNKIHIAIVNDENGDPVGLVTMSDLIEEIFDDLTTNINRAGVPGR